MPRVDRLNGPVGKLRLFGIIGPGDVRHHAWETVKP
jgi:hypothetical protein